MKSVPLPVDGTSGLLQDYFFFSSYLIYTHSQNILQSHSNLLLSIAVELSFVVETPNSRWTAIPVDCRIVWSVWHREVKIPVSDADTVRPSAWNS